VSWQKAIVILAWLSVPVGGSIMLRSSYHEYITESKAQREDCLARAAVLSNYVSQSGHLANQVPLIESVDERHEWERSWSAMLRQRSIESQGLRAAEPMHYPSTDDELLEAERLFKDQMDEVKDAVWKRDAYIKSASGMFELGQQIANTKLTANYYKRIGAEGIYLRIQEDLARLEDTYSKRHRERYRLDREMSDLLTAADRKRRDVLRILRHLETQIAADERMTYKNRLRKHAGDFQLRQELEQLVTGEDQS
jgi:YesN/AraC family two-component response regulator